MCVFTILLVNKTTLRFLQVIKGLYFTHAVCVWGGGGGGVGLPLPPTCEKYSSHTVFVKSE